MGLFRQTVVPEIVNSFVAVRLAMCESPCRYFLAPQKGLSDVLRRIQTHKRGTLPPTELCAGNLSSKNDLERQAIHTTAIDTKMTISPCKTDEPAKPYSGTVRDANAPNGPLAHDRAWAGGGFGGFISSLILIWCPFANAPFANAPFPMPPWLTRVTAPSGCQHRTARRGSQGPPSP
jgi:hypothetical protein